MVPLNSLLLAALLLCCTLSDSLSSEPPRSLLRRSLAEEEEEVELIDELAHVEALTAKLEPKHLLSILNTATNKTSLTKHQFLHLHHMKTGGTSMDGLLNCGMKRLKEKSPSHASTDIAYMNLHECGLSHYRRCRDGGDDLCKQRVNDSSILSYCAPLMDLKTFGWDTDAVASVGASEPREEPLEIKPEIHAVTVFRHPVHRVWSMFRFQTKRCYQCRNLTDVYAAIDAGSADAPQDEICQLQLFNHQTRNLVSYWNASLEDEMVESAIGNMKSFFTLVGLTENMADTAQMVGAVFPFLNETVPESDTTCSMPHSNASPRNNRCGADGKSHWALPDEPDEATKEAILKHNAMDVLLYEQAVQQFEYQRMALGLDQADMA